MIVIVQDQFFPDIEQARTWALSVPLYTQEEYNARFDRAETWPGRRSERLADCHPELNQLIHQCVWRIPQMNTARFHCVVHFRPQGSEDWIHQDQEPLAGVCYINHTQLTSGTQLYTDEGEPHVDLKYVQNRLILYSGSYPHQGYGHWGVHPAEGRTTINLFWDMDQSSR
jgi:hypothetical protein